MNSRESFLLWHEKQVDQKFDLQQELTNIALVMSIY